jgi:hypothetical protein
LRNALYRDRSFCVAANAWPSRTRSASRTSIFLGRLPTSQRKTDRRCDLLKQRSVYLTRWSHSCSRWVADVVVELPTSVATCATLHTTQRPTMSPFCQITI